MANIIREYRTTPASFDLTNAHPFVDWKGSKNLELCVQMIRETAIDWLTWPEKELEKLVKLPEGTRVTRLFYNVFISTNNPNFEPYAEYDHCDFPDAMARQMADDANRGVVTGLFIQVCAAFIYPNGYEDKCYVMAAKTFKNDRHYLGDELIITDKQEPSLRKGKHPPVPLKWNICSLCINWRADHYTDSEKCIYARPRTEASKEYPNIVKGKPLALKNVTGRELFPDPIVLDYNNDELTFQYGECQYTITPTEPFHSDEKGMNYTTFVLSISLKLV